MTAALIYQMEVLAYDENPLWGKQHNNEYDRPKKVSRMQKFIPILAGLFKNVRYCRKRGRGGFTMMPNKTDTFTPAHYYAALKLIEQLYKDGQIPAFMYRNILNEYADVVDLSQFIGAAEKEDAA